MIPCSLSAAQICSGTPSSAKVEMVTPSFMDSPEILGLCPAYRRTSVTLNAVSNPAVIDLLGVLAFGELVAFERTANDAKFAPGVSEKIALGRMAASEYRHYEAVSARIVELGADPIVAMEPFIEPLTQFHNTMEPSNWLEGLLKAYVGDGITADFYREISVYLDPQTVTLVNEVLGDIGIAEFAIDHIKRAIVQDPKNAGKLALWGRRLMGEMISQASLVAKTRPALAGLFLNPPAGVEIDLDNMSTLVSRLTVGHSRRMDALGLAA